MRAPRWLRSWQKQAWCELTERCPRRRRTSCASIHQRIEPSVQAYSHVRASNPFANRFVDAERERASAEVHAGRPSTDRFANLVLLENRCDLLLPLHGPVVRALDELLGEGAVLGDLLEEVVGRKALFNEVACLISERESASRTGSVAATL